MQKVMLTIFRRVVLVLAAIVLIWKIFAINVTDLLVDRVIEGDTNALTQAMVWGPTHPRVLELEAGRLIKAGQMEQADALLVKSIKRNPADSKPLMLLADIRRRAGDISSADKMVETADKLMPVDARTQRQIAFYWYERDRLDLMVPHLSIALSSDLSYSDKLFPMFLKIAEAPGARAALAPIAEAPPIWWDRFAEYAIRNTKNIDSLRVLAQMRKESKQAPISDRERNAYINRLKKDGLLAEAYMLWVGGLDSEQRQLLAYLYNGGFEQEFSHTGFGWYANPPRNSGIVISTAVTFGIVGKQALYLSFRGKRIRFSHLRQSLYLNPGVYQLTGRVRPDKLRARKGLQWVVSCTEGAKGVLGKSPTFLGTGDWRAFSFDILVPPDCEGQLLRLSSVGNRDVDHELNGEIWFDDLRIRLQRDSTDQDISKAAAPSIAVENNASVEKPVSETTLATAETTATESDSVREITNSLLAWAEAWSSVDAERYMDAYVKGYARPKESHQDWVAGRHQSFKNQKYIKVSLSDIRIKKNAEGYSAEFTQNYESNSYQDIIKKELVFVLQEKTWKIESERVK